MWEIVDFYDIKIYIISLGIQVQALWANVFYITSGNLCHLQAACREWRLNRAWETREVQELGPAKQGKTQFML